MIVEIDRWLSGFAVLRVGDPDPLEGLYLTYPEARQCAEWMTNNTFPDKWEPELRGYDAYRRKIR